MQADLKLVAPWAGHTSAVLAVGFHPGGKLLASCGTDGAVCLWTLEVLEPPRLLSSPTPARSAFSCGLMAVPPTSKPICNGV